MGRQVRKTLNRILTALAGLVLLCAGGLVLLGGQDMPRRWNLPAGWPWARPDGVLLSRADRTRWRDQGWWWPVVLAVLVVLALLALWWLLSQFRRNKIGEVLVDTHDGAGARVRGRALEEAVETEVEALPGVARAAARLTGRRTRPALRLWLRLEPHADPSRAVAHLNEATLPGLRDSVGADTLPTEIRLGGVRHGAERVQ
ncbi:alkaline shock response membrane anchor protein AmaP [Streptomyces sp. NPDC059740]|uniref:alkaline shock response membrane anchor protein AmaP n=1 Tax=Streptomyces sp. NPDC059740 TaxID=3346926 RepID=UPI0036510D11